MAVSKRARQKARFIEALAEHYTVRHACEAAGLARRSVYNWRAADTEFAGAWDEAQDDAIDVLENCLYRRALDHDTTAAIFILKGALPEKYRERVTVVTEDAVDAEIRLLAAKLDRTREPGASTIEPAAVDAAG